MTTRWSMLAALIAIIVVLALPILTYPLGRDQGEFATIGRGLLDGKTPYTELWNPKPPAVFYIYALAMQLFGRTAEALRRIDLLMFPAIAIALAWLGWRIRNTRVGLFAVAIFAAFYFTESFWTLTQNDGIVLLPMLLALVCAFLAVDSPHAFRAVIWSLVAGTLTAYTVWFKYPFALFGMVVLGVLLTQRSAASKEQKRGLEEIAAFIAGGLLVMVAGVIYMMSIGAWDALVESARLTSEYTALTFNPADFGQLMQTAIGFRWQYWWGLWILAALSLFLGRVGSLRQWNWMLVPFWLLVALLIMLVQAKGYDYHWLPMLPPLALMAADTVDRLIAASAQRGLARTSEMPAATLTILIFMAVLYSGIWPKSLPYLTGRESQEAYFSRFQGGEFVANESLVVSEFLRERVAPGDSLYIWGFRPEIYFMSQLNPPTRFIFQFPLVGEWYPEEWREQNVDILWAALPPYVLVLKADYMPWVTGRDEDSNTLLQEYNDLNNWLIFNYEQEAQIGNFLIWRRKT